MCFPSVENIGKIMANLTIEGNNIRVDLAGDSADGPPVDIDAWLEENREGFSVKEINAAFSSVCDKDHWKNPVDVIGPAYKERLIAVAISWHTETKAEFKSFDDEPDFPPSAPMAQI